MGSDSPQIKAQKKHTSTEVEQWQQKIGNYTV